MNREKIREVALQLMELADNEDAFLSDAKTVREIVGEQAMKILEQTHNHEEEVVLNRSYQFAFKKAGIRLDSIRNDFAVELDSLDFWLGEPNVAVPKSTLKLILRVLRSSVRHMAIEVDEFHQMIWDLGFGDIDTSIPHTLPKD
jgi:hypothetical protein